MTIRDYEKNILLKLIEKYYKRDIKYQDKVINKRINIKPKEIYKKYDDNNANIEEKEAFNLAVKNLSSFVEYDKIKFGNDYKKIYLKSAYVEEINAYLKDHFAVTTHDFLCHQVVMLCQEYLGSGKIVDYYCDLIQENVRKSLVVIDIPYELKILKALKFIENNKDELYIREASMLIFGSSKVLEEKKLFDNICSIIFSATKKESEQEIKAEILKDYHIYGVEQELLIKGDIKVEINDQIIDLSCFKNGFSLSSADLDNIKNIKIQNKKFITIENKTSFYRFNEVNYACLYLGGYANRKQISLLKLIALNNPELLFYHFGDIDIGGFLIYQHLVNSTSLDIKLYKMGIKELENKAYANCLQRLTENDYSRAKGLKNETIDYMLEHNCKLEQEIISLFGSEEYE